MRDALPPADDALVRHDFEAAFGLRLGPLMENLLRLRERLESLDVCLLDRPEILYGMEGSRRISLTPTNVIPFARTGDGQLFAFLATEAPERSTDERPICHVSRDSPTTRVIAPDLAGFVALLAIAGAWPISRDAPDDAYRAAREEILAEDERRDELRWIERALHALPGVRPIVKASTVTQAHPDIAFECEMDEEAKKPAIVTLPRVQELWSQGKEAEARRTLRALIEKWLDLGNLIPKSNWTALHAVVADVKPELPDEMRQALTRHSAYGHSGPT